MERWAPVNGYENYEVSDRGDIRNKYTNKVLSSKYDRGYERVTLYNKGIRNMKQVHRIVAEAFIDNPENKDEVNHINGDKRDNRIQNLEWCTRSANMKHAYATGLKHHSGGLSKRSLRVIETDQIYYSAYDCARELNLDQGHINQCLTGKRQTHKGYHFEYV